MKKLLLITFAFLLLGTIAVGQSVKITGVVLDSLGQPLQMANVIAYQKDKNLGAFGITNAAGKYQLLDLKKDSTYVVKVSFLGLRTVEDTIKNIQTDLIKNYVLTEGPDELDAVNIVYEMPVSIKGDTIVYNSDSFTNGTERKLGEVLQKLPGVEVNEDGEVQVEGKTVEKIKVNGKDFFEGDTKLATKNIPANAVDKVEVLRNYNDVGQLKGLGNDQDRIAINIRLKEGKENFWFGDATAAVGYGGQDERYLLQPKAFYYSDKLSINILSDLNNLGEPALSGRDYFRFLGFRRNNTQGTGASIGVGTASSFGQINTDRSTNVESKFVGFNSVWSAAKGLDIKTFAIFNRSDVSAFNTNRNIFIENGIQELRTTGEEQEVESALFRIGADINPNENLSIDYDGQFSITNEAATSFTTSASPRGNEEIFSANDQNPFTFDQSLNAYYTLGQKNVFSLESRFISQEEDPFFNAVRDLIGQDDPPPFAELGLQDADPYNLNQNQLVQTDKLDAKVDYWYVINKKSNINLIGGTSIASQNFDSSIFQITDDGSTNNLDDDTVGNDDVQFDFVNLYGGARYKFITGKFTFTPGLIAHSFRTKDRQRGIENTIDTGRILPEFTARYDLRSSQDLVFTYRQSVAFSDVDRYAEGFVLGSFNSLRQGNNQIEGAVSEVYDLRYSDFNMFNYQFISGRLTYTRTVDGFQNEVDLDNINSVSRSINSPFANESISASGRFSREVKKVQLGAFTSINYQLFNNFINGDAQESTNLVQVYGITARSNFQKGVNFSLGYNITFADNDNGAFTNESTTNRINLQADWQIGKRWFLRADYDINYFRDNNGQENNFDFLDALLRYQKPGSKWEYSLIASNILDRDSRVNNTFGQISTSTRSTFVLPRYVYFQVRFDL